MTIQSSSGRVAAHFDGRRKTTTILVVDDSPEIRRYLTLALELEHYRVETACSGEEATLRFREGCEAVIVLLDLQMPGMNGLETLRELRGLRPDIKVIMCSAVDDSETMQEAERLGAEAYLVKPIQQLYLSAAVEHCLDEEAKDSFAGFRGELFALPPPALRPN
jgi:CheY-like chemotaxis protein